MSEVKYVLTTVVRKEKANAEWWDSQTTNKEEVRLFDTFEEAKDAMAEAIKTLTKKNSFFPFKRGKYQPYEEFWQDCDEFIGEDPQAQLFRKVLTNVLSDPGAEIEGIKGLDYHDTDDGDWYFAFVGGKKFILVDYYDSRLETNIHNMTDEHKSYYFTFAESDDEGRVINGIEVRLVKAEEKKLET